MRRARAAHAQRAWLSAATLPGFDPRMVPEVATGYFWSAARTTAFGGTGFRVVEGNGNSTFDLLQATVANQPTALSENGGVQFRCRKAADSNPVQLKTSGNVQAGWTGNTYLAGWFRLPDASGDVTGASTFIAHTTTTAFRVNMTMLINTADRHSAFMSADGTTVATNQWATTMVGGDWHWLEVLFTPGASVELHSDLALVSHATTVTPGAQVNDTNAPVAVGCRGAANLANVDTTDWATVYYGNGIPTLFNRQRLMAHQAPIATSFM